MKYKTISQLEDNKECIDFNCYCLFNFSKIFFLNQLKLNMDEISSALYTDFIRRSSKDKKRIKKMNKTMVKILKAMLIEVHNESKN